MNLIQICIISVMGVGLILLLKGTRPEFGYLLAMGICILLFAMAIGNFSRVLEEIQGLAEYLGSDGGYLKILVKMIFVSFVPEFVRMQGRMPLQARWSFGGSCPLWRQGFRSSME